MSETIFAIINSLVQYVNHYDEVMTALKESDKYYFVFVRGKNNDVFSTLNADKVDEQYIMKFLKSKNSCVYIYEKQTTRKHLTNLEKFKQDLENEEDVDMMEEMSANSYRLSDVSNWMYYDENGVFHFYNGTDTPVIKNDKWFVDQEVQHVTAPTTWKTGFGTCDKYGFDKSEYKNSLINLKAHRDKHKLEPTSKNEITETENVDEQYEKDFNEIMTNWFKGYNITSLNFFPLRFFVSQKWEVFSYDHVYNTPVRLDVLHRGIKCQEKEYSDTFKMRGRWFNPSDCDLTSRFKQIFGENSLVVYNDPTVKKDEDKIFVFESFITFQDKRLMRVMKDGNPILFKDINPLNVKIVDKNIINPEKYLKYLKTMRCVPQETFLTDNKQYIVVGNTTLDIRYTVHNVHDKVIRNPSNSKEDFDFIQNCIDTDDNKLSISDSRFVREMIQDEFGFTHYIVYDYNTHRFFAHTSVEMCEKWDKLVIKNPIRSGLISYYTWVYDMAMKRS